MSGDEFHNQVSPSARKLNKVRHTGNLKSMQRSNLFTTKENTDPKKQRMRVDFLKHSQHDLECLYWDLNWQTNDRYLICDYGHITMATQNSKWRTTADLSGRKMSHGSCFPRVYSCLHIQ